MHYQWYSYCLIALEELHRRSCPIRSIVSMPRASDKVETPVLSLLPIYRTDVAEMVERAGTWLRQDEAVLMRDELRYVTFLYSFCDLHFLLLIWISTPSHQKTGICSAFLRRCYGSVRKLFGSHRASSHPDVEAAVTGKMDPVEGTVLEPTGLERQISRRTQSKDKSRGVHEVKSHHTAADPDQHSTCDGLAVLTIGSDSSSKFLSDEENERMNRNIDKLIAAIDDRRPIHFAPDAETGEVEVFADHEVTDQDQEDELERQIAASPGNFGPIIRFDNGVHRIRSLYSLRYAGSTDSWASTDSEKSSSNAWKRAVAAANIRFALAQGTEEVDTVVRQPIRDPRMARPLLRDVSPIPLDFNKSLRMSTPSVFSYGSEQDTSSPLFEKSCERIYRETYAQPPKSTFQREYLKDSQVDDRAFISEPHLPSPEAREAKAPSSTGRAFGVFQDRTSGGTLFKETGKLPVRSKALKDISNLRRPGYLQFNSFAKEAKATDGRPSTAVPTAAPPTGFEGASDPKSGRAYIKSQWSELLEDRRNSSMAKPPEIDGAARRRNEQAIGSPIDRSLYSLPESKAPVADSPLDVDSIRQAHFDLALARLEGRALPPPPSSILRHPDWAALFDRDVHMEGGHRPLPLRGPAPSKPANPALRRNLWHNFW